MERQSEVRWRCLPLSTRSRDSTSLSRTPDFVMVSSNVERGLRANHLLTNTALKRSSSGRCVFEVRERVLARASVWIGIHVLPREKRYTVANGAEVRPPLTRSRFPYPSAGRWCSFEIGGLANTDKDSGGLRVTGCGFTRTTEPSLKASLALSRVMESPLFARGMSKGSLIFAGWVDRETGAYTVVESMAHDMRRDL